MTFYTNTRPFFSLKLVGAMYSCKIQRTKTSFHAYSQHFWQVSCVILNMPYFVLNFWGYERKIYIGAFLRTLQKQH